MSTQRSGVGADAGPIATLPRSTGGLSRGRRGVGILVAGLGLPLLTLALVSVRSSWATESMLMIYLLAVVVVAVVGGVLAALIAAILDNPLITVHDLHQAGILPVDPGERSPENAIAKAHEARTLFA